MEPTEEHYEKAYSELENEEAKPGLYAKCLAEQMGDLDKAKALYIKVRAGQIAGIPDKEMSESNDAQPSGSSSNTHSDEKSAGRPSSPRWFHMGTFGVGVIMSLCIIPAVYIFTAMGIATTSPDMAVNEFRNICFLIAPLTIGYSIAYWINASLPAARWHHKLWAYAAWILACILCWAFWLPAADAALLGWLIWQIVEVVVICIFINLLIINYGKVLSKRHRVSIANFIISSIRYLTIAVAFCILLGWL